jgi:DNA-binding MarR family transcriptional regulator
VAQPDPADLPIIGRRNKRRDPTTSASRALQHLSQPRYGKELAKLLGVSVQQVRNVVERLHAEGSIRVADPDEPAFVIARAADPNVLLTRAEARVLSSFPDAGYVSSGRVRVVCKYAAPDVDLILARLRQYGLTTSTRRRWRNRPTMLYQLTDRGRQHWQRSRDLRKAHPIPPYPSKRVFMVLKFLAENQPTKAKQVSDSLAIPYQSTNALLQYFKRQNLAYRADRKTPHGYMITEHGNDVLADLEIYWQSVSKG